MNNIHILLVDDNGSDVFLMKESLRNSERGSIVHIASDGIEASDYLFKRKKFADAPTPDLVILDLNLPKKSGSEVLQEMKENNFLRHIPVVIFTSSDSEAERRQMKKLGADLYIVKPFDLTTLFEVLEAIEDFGIRLRMHPHDRDNLSIELNERVA